MRKTLLFAIGAALTLASCESTSLTENDVLAQKSEGVSFTSMGTKASGAFFENGDQIAVSAFSQDAPYAEGVKYTYGSDNVFESADPIEYANDQSDLSFFAVYPYVDGSDYSSFVINTDQSSHENYTTSDLMTASVEATHEECPDLYFTHCLTNLNFNIESSDVDTNDAVVRVNAMNNVSCDFENEKFTASGNVATITAREEGENYFQSIVAPQNIEAEAEFVSVTVGGVEYTWAPAKEVVLEAGKTYNLNMKISDGELEINGLVNPWDVEPTVDESVDRYVKTLHAATKGNNLTGVKFIIVGDGFVADDMKPGGDYHVCMENAAEAILDIEPMTSYADYVNIYSVNAISNKKGVTSTWLNENSNDTVFDTYISNDGTTEIGGTHNTAFEYAREVPGFDRTKDIVIVMVNADKYAGTCYSYSDNSVVGYVPYLLSDGHVLDYEHGSVHYDDILHHEIVGHGFGKFVDEYIYYYDEIDSQTKEDFSQSRLIFGMGYNLTVDYNDVPWDNLIGVDGYDEVDMFEGGYFYSQGVWRSEYNSCMNNNIPYFSATCRELIVKRIMEQAGVEYDFDSFVAIDKSSGANKAPEVARVPSQMVTDPSLYLHSPVLINLNE